MKISYLSFNEMFSFFSPAWAVTDGRIFFALYPQVCQDAIAQARAGNKSLLDNVGFVEAKNAWGMGRWFIFPGRNM